jgi:endogenous inhibitor of DNA gyrase (YacG/DUF329 family)
VNTTHLKCPKCGGEFDFEEASVVKRPGMNAMATIRYNGREMPVHVVGIFSVRYIHCPHCGKRSKFNVKTNPYQGIGV